MMSRCWVLTLATLAVSAQGINFYSREKEAALGAALAKEMDRQTKPSENIAVGLYVASVGRRLAAQLPDTGLTWTFTPVVDPLGGHEPFGLPGGFIFVPEIVLLEAQSEAEFAGMLAHAMAHVAERHGTRMATRGQIGNAATIPLVFMGGWSGTGNAGSVLVPARFLKLQRTYEIDADQLAVRMMDGAGYDPGALARFIRRVLPSDYERIALLDEAIHELPLAKYSFPNEEFQQIQEELRLMPVPTDEPPRSHRPPSLLRP